MSVRIIISGGGTGGHIFPAISIANELKQRVKDIEILFVGAKGRMEMEKVPASFLSAALEKANLSTSDVDYFELNEAFSVVGLANIEILGLDASKVNLYGGAVSLGHPLGCSGTRIIVTLINILKQNKAKIGAAGICNGGGGASAMVIEKI